MTEIKNETAAERYGEDFMKTLEEISERDNKKGTITDPEIARILEKQKNQKSAFELKEEAERAEEEAAQIKAEYQDGLQKFLSDFEKENYKKLYDCIWSVQKVIDVAAGQIPTIRSPYIELKNIEGITHSLVMRVISDMFPADALARGQHRLDKAIYERNEALKDKRSLDEILDDDPRVQQIKAERKAEEQRKAADEKWYQDTQNKIERDARFDSDMRKKHGLSYGSKTNT